MKIILKENNKYIIRFDRNEEIIESLTNFCKEKNIKTGFFWGIGAAKEVDLEHYDIDKKEYSGKLIEEKLEIVDLVGNIAIMEGKIIIHFHGSFANSNLQLIGGHIKKLVIAATCEILLEVFEGKVERKYSEEIGLNLME
ncbi:MAG: DNA-binding protein [Candidatus Nealsonbacteria bacterium CG_4_10_14_0_2_um_filter_38_17]|uniref:DNA-binding protein n=2 Tax=Candidatus Nealsoniibacteriota TaxID=1817911 RepID=A0A2M7UYS3_9BACT|nr:MAG: DNA-binding protein [Candidatus Nealsonbacteria bacterium CG23_combo_of_CG06-09_8_20_14_all_38_19]PIZ89131.1 MAG: DNA-binding protein [Candidatus Nealsonbacteria bacterium CG_4_10_14_0_2_um_filter_38_17]